ncbi:hypothetical protein [Desulfosporosinus acidiphilus]|uniref:hypothetical protein n=1 Tax=Desulfosporosinus acidiphilus TaxID=885581 RepID=UPI000A05A66C|nr:hypothetical protein [Desulfosporosinus acidiphilus]
MKNVRIIPPKPKEHKKLRVAAYCRVSTSGPEQMRSLVIHPTTSKCEKVLPKLREGTSQYTLMVRRMKALQIAAALITRKLEGKCDA